MPVMPLRRTWSDYSGLALSAADLNAMEQDIANAVFHWQPNTSYIAGQAVVDQNGSTVTRTSTGTSASTYAVDAANWTNPGAGNNPNIDGGSASAVYLASQNLDGGTANG